MPYIGLESPSNEALRCAEALVSFISSLGQHQGEYIASFHEWLGTQEAKAVQDFGWQKLVELQEQLARLKSRGGAE